MNRTDIDAMTKVMAGVVRSYFEQSVAPIIRRLDVLEARPVPVSLTGGFKNEDGVLVLSLDNGKLHEVGCFNGRDGKDGINGKDGFDGAPGKDGKDGRDGKDGESGLNGKDGRDGKDAEPVTKQQIIDAILSMPTILDAAVAKYIAANPPLSGKDGADGVDGKDGAPGRNGVDGKDGCDGIDGKDGLNGKDGRGHQQAMIDRDGRLVLSYTDGTIQTLDVVVGRDGKDGAGCDMVAVERAIDAAVAAKMAEQIIAKATGGKLKIDDVRPLIEAEVIKAVAAVPIPKDGKDGVPGADGRDGLDGKDGSPGKDGAPGLDGKDGTNGRDGIDGQDGRDGIDGKDGAPGLDGKHSDPNEIANLLLPEIKTFLLGNPQFKGEKGDPGEDGRDGRDGLPGGPPGPKGEKGDPGLSIEYKDVYQPGKSYQEGNCVTFGGSIWICRRDTDDKPGISDAWRLAVKRPRAT